jgi:hypothetical protein
MWFLPPPPLSPPPWVGEGEDRQNQNSFIHTVVILPFLWNNGMRNWTEKGWGEGVGGRGEKETTRKKKDTG